VFQEWDDSQIRKVTDIHVYGTTINWTRNYMKHKCIPTMK
jgi:hypothetical protein